MTTPVVVLKRQGLGYVAHIENSLYRIAGLREVRGDLFGELTVSDLLAEHDQLLFRGSVNLSSLRERSTLAGYLKQRAKRTRRPGPLARPDRALYP